MMVVEPSHQHGLVMKKLFIGLTFACMATACFAQSDLSDREIEAGYHAAITARLSYQPELAESILSQLVQARPNEPQLIFDLGVAQAEQGDCVRASRTLSRGEDLAKTPTFARASDIAMEDLCPRLAPWDLTSSFSIGYDDNLNGGSNQRNIEIRGIPFTLSDDAMAQGGYGYTVAGAAAYNFSISRSDYLVPSAGISLSDREGDEYDSLTITTGLSYRHRGDVIDWRVGPEIVFGFDKDGLSQKGRGVRASASWISSSRAGFYFSASHMIFEGVQTDQDDRTTDVVSARYVRQLSSKGYVARVAMTASRNNYDFDLQDLKTRSLEVGMSGPLTKRIGFDVYVQRALNDGDITHPVFGVKRSDVVTTVSAQASFASLEGWYGRPYIGVAHTLSDSSFDTKDYSKSAVTFGVTRQF